MLLTFLASAEPVIQDRAHIEARAKKTEGTGWNKRSAGIREEQECSVRSVSMTETHYVHAGKCHHETHYVMIVL